MRGRSQRPATRGGRGSTAPKV